MESNPEAEQIGIILPEEDERENDCQDFEKPVAIAKVGNQNPPYKEIAELFNSICGMSYPTITGIKGKRAEAVRARWKENGENLDVFRIIFERMENSAFLKGQVGDFKACFDWAMKPSNFQKILEGNYENRSRNGRGSGWDAIRAEAYGGQE